MNRFSYDTVVIGAGPAGAIASYYLAKSGLHAALIEKEDIPRYKPCGGVVGTRVEKILDFSIEPVIERKITKAKITVNLKDQFLTQSLYPFVYLVMRDKFDAFLVNKACEAGVELFTNEPLQRLEKSDERYTLITPGQKFETKYIVAADGANGPTRKLLNLNPFKRLSVAFEREIHGDNPKLKGWENTIAMDYGHLSSGYAWVFPKAEIFSIGAGGPRSLAKELKPYCDKFIDCYMNEIGDGTPFRTTCHFLPIRTKGERIVHGNVLFVGDAAGLIDPMAGEGIYYAMRSGQLAAESIINCLKNSNISVTEYEKKVDSEIQPDLQIAKSLLFMQNLSPRFWIPRYMKSDSYFWKFFYKVFTGESEYKNFPRKFGVFGRMFFALLDKILEK
ncbi:geranylgeranyl reductase family protein [bacterium]|nr:geranylgeranyl reductase family protein [bacterium]